MMIETSAAPEDAATATTFAVCFIHWAFFAESRILSIAYRTAINRVPSRFFSHCLPHWRACLRLPTPTGQQSDKTRTPLPI